MQKITYLLILILGLACFKRDYDITILNLSIYTKQVTEVTPGSAVIIDSFLNPTNYSGIEKIGVWYSSTDSLLKNQKQTVYVVNNPQNVVSTAVFRVAIEGLQPETPYFVRAVAISNLDTVFGEIVRFRTAAFDVKVQTNVAKNISTNSFKAGLTVENPNLLNIEAGIVYSSVDTNPSLSSGTKLNGIDRYNGLIEKDFSALLPGTTYYYRGYIKYNNLVVYGEKLKCKTLVVPSVLLDPITEIYQTTATANILIANQDSMVFGTYGVCYNKIGAPTIADSTISFTGGKLQGNFMAMLQNLTSNTTYYVRAYLNYNGTVYYSSSKSFNTLSFPQVSIASTTSITTSSANLSINIANLSRLNIVAAGICYSTTNTTPVTTDNFVAINGGVLSGSYSVNLNSLTMNKIYYIRAYINYNGVIYYSTAQNFSTSSQAVVSILASTNVATTAATGNFSITNPSSLSLTAAGVCYSSSNAMPVTTDNFVSISGGVLSGNYSANITGLTSNTTYYVRAYYSYNGVITYSSTVQNFKTNIIIPTVSITGTNNVTSTAATANFSITNPSSVNITTAGVCYSNTNTTPTVSNGLANITAGNLSGDYSANITGLAANTTYYTRAYINYNGTVYYSSVVHSFTTNPTIPTVSILATNNITTIGATANFSITNPNSVSITTAGICYSGTNTMPVTTDNFVSLSGGVLSGNYTANITGLTANTTYYVRAYINYNGTVYYSSTVQSFTTLILVLPTVTISTVTNLTNNTATANFSVSNPSLLTNISAAGVCYSNTNNLPTISNSLANYYFGGTLNGSYTVNLTGLTANTTYYMRAYFNYNGTVYYSSTVQSFTTLVPSLANLEANMVTVPGGSFTMGATSEQLTNNSDGFIVFWSPSTQQVTLSSYKICRFEVTQQLWLDVMGSNPSYFTGDLQRPVERVSWNDCQAFITKLNQLTGKSYRLPTEAEWEYAARGGASTITSYIYSGSNTLNNVAWNNNNSGGRTRTVGTKQANALGIFDMSGNVWEWCNDWDSNYSSTAVTNPIGPSSGTGRVIRGGSWGNYGYCRVSFRSNYGPSFRNNYLGLRLCLP